MKKSVMKAAAMKAMKKSTPMKAMARVMKKKAVSKIARGKLAKAVVLRGGKEKTASGKMRSDLMKNKRGRVVSKAQYAAGKKAFKNISRWNISVVRARNELGIKGFCAINGKTAQGQALYAKAKAIFAAWEVQTQAVSAYVVVHGAPHLPVDLQSLQIELSLYSLCVEHLREDCQFVLAKIEGFCGCRDSRRKTYLAKFFSWNKTNM